MSVKIITEDDESLSDIVVQGDEEEIERFQKTLDLRYVPVQSYHEA